MTKDERREHEKNHRREMILDTAEALALSRGFDMVNINDIAEAAGYTRRSIYLYFRDRDDIFYCIVHRGQKLFLENIRKAAEKHSAGAETVGAFCDAVFNFASGYPGYFDLILQYELKQHDYGKGRADESSPKSLCQNISISYGSIVTEAIQADIDEGRIKSDLTAQQLMLVLWGQVFGLLQIMLKRRDDFATVYGIEQKDFLEEFKLLLKKNYY